MDDLTPQQRRRNMKYIKSRDTKPELTLRRALWHSGLRGYRKNYQALPGKPDIAYTRYKIAVFVDGEYFHGKDWNNGLKERTQRGTNASYWTAKIERNIRHDCEVESRLRSLGWQVIRFWSRDVLKNPDECVKRIREAVFDSQVLSD